jgi:hypothetical protein
MQKTWLQIAKEKKTTATVVKTQTVTDAKKMIVTERGDPPGW